MADVSLVLAPYGRPGPRRRRRRRARPDPHGVPPGDRHGPLRVGPHERADRPPVRLTDDPRRPRDRTTHPQDPRRGAHRGARRLAGRPRSPRSTTLTAERDDARREGGRVPGRPPARARRVHELQAPHGRGARARARARRRGPDPQGPQRSPTTSTGPSTTARTTLADERVGRGHRRDRPQAPRAPRERGRERRSRRRPARRSTPASTRPSSASPAPAAPRARSSTRSAAATGSATGSSGPALVAVAAAGDARPAGPVN